MEYVSKDILREKVLRLCSFQTSLSSFGIPSFSSRDENDENNRSRLDSSASDISQIANYTSPIRQSIPPSDIESEHGADESDHETTTVNSFNSLN